MPWLTFLYFFDLTAIVRHLDLAQNYVYSVTKIYLYPIHLNNMEMDADMDGAPMGQGQYSYAPPDDGRKQLYVISMFHYPFLLLCVYRHRSPSEGRRGLPH